VRTIRASFLLIAVTVICPVCLFSEPAAADESGVYIGANVGRVLGTYRRADLDNALTAAFGGTDSGFLLGSTSIRKSHAMWSADIGYMVSRYVGIEASYLDLGTLDYAASAAISTASAAQSVSVNTDIESRGPALALIGVLPMTDSWDMAARIGAYRGRTHTDFTSNVGTNSNSGSLSEASTSLLAGVRASYILSSHCTIRLDYIRIEHAGEKLFDRAFNVDLVTAGLSYVY
jgi:opacity protein-like surface antigen